MRLLCRVGNDGLPLCLYRSQHDVDGGPYADYVHIDLIANKAVRFGPDHAMFNIDLRAKSFQPLDVLINGTRPDFTASGKRYLHLSKPSKKNTQQIVGSAQALYHFKRSFMMLQRCSVNHHPAGLAQIHPGSQFRKNICQYNNVINIR